MLYCWCAMQSADADGRPAGQMLSWASDAEATSTTMLSWICRWADVPCEALLQGIAQSTEGFAGADLQALCTAAVMAAARRAAPSLIDQLCNEQGPKKRNACVTKQQEQSGPAGAKEGALPQPQQVQEQEELLDEQPQGHSHPGPQQQQHRQQMHPQQGLSLCQQQQSQQQQPKQQQQQELSQQQQHTSSAFQALSRLRVRARDWRAALAVAPAPCSARQSEAALSTGHARALPHHLAPLLLPGVEQVTRDCAWQDHWCEC